MSNRINAGIIVFMLIVVGVLILSGIVLRNSFFVLGGCGLLLASFVMFSSIVEQNE